MVYLKNVVTLKLVEEKCVGCGTCLLVCPHGVLRKANGGVQIEDRDACMECGACAENCPVGAVTVKSGVGCATAVLNAALGRNQSSCCCVIEEKNPCRTPEPCAGEREVGDGIIIRHAREACPREGGERASSEGK